jgi:hypothetical protein
VDVKDGVSAGTVSGVVNNSGLPGNTHITASPSGLTFAGSDSGADVKFGISITPDTSFDLNTFLDLRLSSWDIHVGWPADWCTSADDILAEIVRGLQGAGASMNTAVLTKLVEVAAGKTSLPLSTVLTFFDTDASLTCMDVTYPTPYTWPMANTTDSTVVVAGDVCSAIRGISRRTRPRSR